MSRATRSLEGWVKGGVIDAAIDRLFWPAVAAVVLLGVLTMFAGVLVWGVLR